MAGRFADTQGFLTGEEIARRHGVAQQLAREAGAIARRYFRSGAALRIAEKGVHDLVTQADLEVDRFLIERLGDAFPKDGVLTEESGGAAARHLWVIDPIDGTQNFARGIAHFAISIAFHADGRTESGVVYDPIADEMFAARRGCGAFLNGERLHVRDPAAPHDAVVEAGYSLKRPTKEYTGLVDRLLEAGYGFLQNGSAAIGLAHVACGRTDAYCELFLNSWDVLAGLLLVEEAGGWASDFTANGGLEVGNPVLACGPRLQGTLSALTGIV